MLASPGTGGRWALACVLGVQLVLPVIVGGTQIASAVSSAGASGILDFHRVTPLPPSTSAPGYCRIDATHGLQTGRSYNIVRLLPLFHMVVDFPNAKSTRTPGRILACPRKKDQAASTWRGTIRPVGTLCSCSLDSS